MNSQRVHLGVKHKRVGGQVPAVQGNGRRSILATAERKDTGNERQLTQFDPIDEVLTPAIDGVPNLQVINPIFRDPAKENGIRMKLEIIVKSNFLARRIVQRQRRLKPAGHRVRQIGNQFACLGDGYQPSATMCLKAKPIHIPRQNLAINNNGQLVLNDIVRGQVVRFRLATFRVRIDLDPERI